MTLRVTAAPDIFDGTTYTKSEESEENVERRAISDFGDAAGREAAQNTAAEVEVIRLSQEAQEQFVALLSNPPPPSDALLRALDRHRSLIAE